MRVKLGDYSLEFFDCAEVCQGGPLACSVTIDGWHEGNRRFDPSPLLFEDRILLPMRRIGFFKSGYVLTQLDPRDFSIKVVSKIHAYMRLKQIEGRRVEYFTTAWSENTAFLEIP